MKEYTVGFIFNADLSKVLLVHKTHPPFMVGRCNGIGGKIEEGESIVDGFIREVVEETGLTLSSETVKNPGYFTGQMGRVHLLAAQYNGDEADAKTMTEETVVWHPVNQLPETVVDNLRWFIPLSLDVLEHDSIESIVVTFNSGQ